MSASTTDVALLAKSGNLNSRRDVSAVDPNSLSNGLPCIYQGVLGATGSMAVPTQDERLVAKAADLLRRSYPKSYPPPLNQCFLTSRETPFYQPRRSETRYYRPVTGNRHGRLEAETLQITEANVVVAKGGEDWYILQF